MASPRPPVDRKSFRVAIVCALSREADAISLLFDDIWEHDLYGRADGDTNHYINGRIGDHNVVLAVLPGMGTNSAAAATASLRSSYLGLRLAIIVGICGGVPHISRYGAFLGDVVVSKSIIQYDYGRQYPGHFEVKNTVEDSLARPNLDIQGLLKVFEMRLMRDLLHAEASNHLQRAQDVARERGWEIDYQYPGANKDRLYAPSYVHKHRTSCDLCVSDVDSFCDRASKVSCVETECDPASLVARERPVRDGKFTPKIYIGRIGSGNTVMKSGEERDRIAARHDLIAFEMEGAGAWDVIPCIVVKGICDYADSHKNKDWQDFAAATAASVARAILGRYTVHDGDRDSTQDRNMTQNHELPQNHGPPQANGTTQSSPTFPSFCGLTCV